MFALQVGYILTITFTLVHVGLCLRNRLNTIIQTWKRADLPVSSNITTEFLGNIAEYTNQAKGPVIQSQLC